MPWSLAAQSSGTIKRRRTPRDRERDAKRGSPAERGYGADWVKVRKRVLKRDGFLCASCGKRAVLVHHEPPISGPDDPGRLDEARCVSMCRACHEQRHGR